MLRNVKKQTSDDSSLIKTDLLEISHFELSNALVHFTSEVRHLNGTEYSSDAIFNVTLCVQKYLSDHRSVDIFYDAHYEQFTDCLDEKAKGFQLKCENAPSKKDIWFQITYYNALCIIS